MKKVIKVIDEDTLELKEVEIDVEDEETDTSFSQFRQALNCEPEEFFKKYEAYKNAEADFNAIYEPFKEKIMKIYEDKPDLPKTLIIGGAKVTYVSPCKRTSIDTKKLKEEEPELAKQYTKCTEVKASLRIH